MNATGQVSQLLKTRPTSRCTGSTVGSSPSRACNRFSNSAAAGGWGYLRVSPRRVSMNQRRVLCGVSDKLVFLYLTQPLPALRLTFPLSIAMAEGGEQGKTGGDTAKSHIFTGCTALVCLTREVRMRM